MPDKKEKEMSDNLRQIFDAAFALIERTDGDIEFARHLWDEAFEEAERIDHNQSLDDDMEDWERAVVEQTARHEQAIEARKQFLVVNPDKDTTS
jgi:hypothetical protein